MSSITRTAETPRHHSTPGGIQARIEDPQHEDREQAARIVWHPHFVLRIGGEPVDALRSLRSGSAARAHELADERRRRMAGDLAPLCARLEALVPRTEEKAQQRDLITLKRDLFNGRSPKPAVVARVETLLDDGTRERLAEAVKAIERLRELDQAAVAAYEADLAEDSAALRAAASLPNLRAALYASSPSLFQALLKLESDSPLRRKDWNNLNLAISSFLTRSTLKTSPKSSLTLVALGEWDPAGPRRVGFDLDGLAVRRDVRLRHSVVDRVFRPLVADAALLSPAARLTANPTMRVADDHVEWQRIAYSESPERETYGITATTNRLPAKPGLLAILRDIAASDGPRSLGDHAAHLQARAGYKSESDAYALLGRLMSLELLVLEDVVPAQRDRADWARSVARSAKPSLATALEAGLDRLEAARRALCASDGGVAAGAEVEQTLDELAALTGSPARAAQCRPVFHEDCIVASPAVRLSRDALDDLRGDLLDLTTMLPLLRGYGWASAWLLRRFVTSFGAGGRCPDPVAFLAETAEALASSGDSASASPPWQTGSVPEEPDALAQDAVAAAFASALQAHNHGAETWTIPQALIRRFHRTLPASYRRRQRSHCINGQFVSNAGTSRFVVNSVYPGNARMTSRFLGDPAAAAAYVAELAPGLPVAIPGMFGFNANRHPPLSAHEFHIPPYSADYAETHKYRLDRCTLRHDAARNRLILEDESGKRLSPFFFGILNSWALPPVLRVLDWMSGASDLPFSIGRAIFSHDAPTDPNAAWTSPRLALGSLVLARKSHSVPAGSLPDPNLAEADFYFALRDAWNRLELPRLSFFRASNAWQQQRSDPTMRAPKTRKPMYLDIDNVWLVKGFQRALRAIQGHVSFTEALPQPGDSPLTVSGKRHASEVTIELGLKEADV